MKIGLLLMIIVLTACSDTSDKAVSKLPEVKTSPDKEPLLKGYKDNLQKAKDMEKQVLKNAKDKKRALEEALKK